MKLSDLRRYYAVCSVIGALIVVIGLSYYSRHLGLQTLLSHQSQASEGLANGLANLVGVPGFVEDTRTRFDDLDGHPAVRQLHAVSDELIKQTSIVGVNLYNTNGVIVFSKDPEQISAYRGSNTEFLSAMSGVTGSEFTFRNKSYGFEQVIDKDIVSTYIPISGNTTNIPIAVFELYADVTPLLADMSSTQNRIGVGIFLLLVVLHGFLYLIVDRADILIKQQEREHTEREKKLHFQAFHDSLTGLPNRSRLTEHLALAIARATRHGKIGALMFLDLDRFKLVNDSLGHDVGDHLLQATASRLRACLRDTDMAFRLSGDEFVVVIEDLNNVVDSAIVAKRILQAMRHPVELNNREIIVNVSIGITTFPRENLGMEELLKEADTAMYRAKIESCSQFEFFSTEMSMKAGAELSMEVDLQRAITERADCPSLSS